MRENKVELLKKEKDGLDVWADIEGYARTGFNSIDAGDLDRFRWYGLYTQRPADEGFFMLRIKVANGILSSDQLETIGWLSKIHGRNSGDITTRQGIQYHYIKIEDVPHIVDELQKAGLTTQEACGDVVRNVVGCPLAGIDDDELLDVTPLVYTIQEKFISDKAFSNLPRKFKISITGCTHECAQHEINDLGLTAVVNDDGDVGFEAWVGGGLGAIPFISKNLGVFVRYNEVIEVVTRIIEIYREHGNREDRKKSRIKFLIAKWGIEKFRDELESRLGRKLEDTPKTVRVEPKRRDHIGVYDQRRPGLKYVGVAVLRGRITGEQMIAVAGLARRYGSGNIRLTNTQNLIILDVPYENIDPLNAELITHDLLSDASPFRRETVSCTGREFCKLAVVETKDRAREIIYHLESAHPGFIDDLRISVTGCVNSCAQYQIADIGLVGVKSIENGEEVHYFQIHLGGHLGLNAGFGRKISKRIPVEDTKFYLERVVRSYLNLKNPGEKFYKFIERQDAKALELLDTPEFIEHKEMKVQRSL